MPNTSYTKFKFKLVSVYWDPGFDTSPDSLDVNTGNAVQFDAAGYWYTAGESDGRQKTGTKVDFINQDFRDEYQSGYNDGAWKRLVIIQG